MNNVEKEGVFDQAPEFTKIDGMINVPIAFGAEGKKEDKTLSMAALKGKRVVLVHFWTLSCASCRRDILHVQAWHERYKQAGLTVIGIHTPEYDFEKSHANVFSAVKEYGITYPVVLDSHFYMWRAYGNQHWPRTYLIDMDGFIVYDHIGEGGYEDTEKKIQELLMERVSHLRLTLEIPAGVTMVPDAARPAVGVVGETKIHLGMSRNVRLGNGTRGSSAMQTLEMPEEIEDRMAYLVGEWKMQREHVENHSIGAQVIVSYTGSDLHVVAESSTGDPITVKILYDDEVMPESVWGKDIIDDGAGIATLKIKEPRLYHLVESGGSSSHVVRCIIDDPGLRVFSFAFS